MAYEKTSIEKPLGKCFAKQQGVGIFHCAKVGLLYCMYVVGSRLFLGEILTKLRFKS